MKNKTFAEHQEGQIVVEPHPEPQPATYDKDIDIMCQEIENKQPRQQRESSEQSIDNTQDDISQSVRLDFKDVCYEVTLKGGQKKKILNNVSGYVLPGEILYIMGPSGGGKTSLLDFLCNRTKVSPENNVYLNQKKWTLSEFKKIARYCQQYPQLFEVLTVQETLEYAASFFTKTKQDRKERVDRVIDMLGLEHQRKTKIGGLFFRGISGGQKQRVSVGEQLVANPKLLFLDEPTSGLDSATAFQLMDKLKNICQKTKITIVSSIHQPSQRVFDFSDRVIILAGGKGFGGNTAYFGPTEQIENHFNQIGIYNHSNSAISEWILDEVNGDFGNQNEIKQILEQYSTSEVKKETDIVQKFVENPESIGIYQYNGPVSKQSQLLDICQLISRGFKNNLKNPLALGIRIITYCAMAFVLGSVWWNAADEPKAGGITNILGILFFTAAFFSFLSISILPGNIEERFIMIKERSNGAYSVFAFSVANFIVSVPLTFIISLTSGSVVFFMAGFDTSDGKYFKFILNYFLTLVASEAQIMLVGCIFSNFLICMVLISFVFGAYMIMNGFFIKKDDIPIGWKWLHYSAYNTYSFQNFAYDTFQDLTIKKDLSINPPANADFPGMAVVKDLDLEDVNTTTNFLILIAFIVVFRIFSFLYSHFKHTGKK